MVASDFQLVESESISLFPQSYSARTDSYYAGGRRCLFGCTPGHAIFFLTLVTAIAFLMHAKVQKTIGKKNLDSVPGMPQSIGPGCESLEDRMLAFEVC